MYVELKKKDVIETNETKRAGIGSASNWFELRTNLGLCFQPSLFARPSFCSVLFRAVCDTQEAKATAAELNRGCQLGCISQ